jgi:hypothetical protein
MSYAGDNDAAGSSLYDFWMDLYRKVEAGTKAEEESEAVGAGDVDSCQEDPAYRHQYPGCPFAGPASAKTISHKATEIPLTPKDKKGKKTGPQAGLELERAGWSFFSARKIGTLENSPRRPCVDTMEFRPSDWKTGEHDSTPYQ